MRRESDYYPTPEWCTHRMLDVMWPAVFGHRHACDPCAGDGAIIRAVSSYKGCNDRPTPAWLAWDIRAEAAAQLSGLVASPMTCDALHMQNPGCTIVTNPPFSLAFEFAKWAVAGGNVVIMLMRLNWLASAKRSAWLRENTPSVLVLPQRPSFTGKGTDSIDYAWMVWQPEAKPRTIILADTPLSERRGMKCD